MPKDFCQLCNFPYVAPFQAKEFGRKAVVASEGNPDDSLSRSIIEFMKNCERVPKQTV